MAALGSDLRGLTDPLNTQVADAVTPDGRRAVRRVYFVGSGNPTTLAVRSTGPCAARGHGRRVAIGQAGRMSTTRACRHPWFVLAVCGPAAESSPAAAHAFSGHLAATLADLLGREPFQPVEMPRTEADQRRVEAPIA